MKSRSQQFEERRLMSEPDFEVVHTWSDTPLQVEYHSHEFCEVLMFLSGEVTYMVESRAYHLRPGDIILTSSSELHRPLVTAGRRYERYVVWLSWGYLRQVAGGRLAELFDSASPRARNMLRPGAELLKAITQVLDLLVNLNTDHGYEHQLLRDCYMQELLVYLNRASLGDSGDFAGVLYNEKVSNVIEYISQHLGEELSLDSLADKFYISKYHLLRQFKAATELTLHQYILKKRLLTARELLAQGSSATEASMNVGFADYSHFSRSFKEEYGVSPRQYARKQREEAAFSFQIT